METFYKRKPPSPSEESSTHRALDECRSIKLGPSLEKKFLEFDLEMLPSDPGLRPKMADYHPSDREEIRRYYLQKGPCQPKEMNFPLRKCGEHFRKFNPDWYSKFGNWLEYSQMEDATYCLYCYLMRSDVEEHKGSGDAFITQGFTNWKNSDRFRVHVGSSNSFHNQAWLNCQALMKEKQHIEGVLCKQSHQVREEYRIHLTAVLDCIRFLLRQGLAFRGNDEALSSSNKGNFLELLDFLVNHNEIIYKVWKKARGNLKLTAPKIQKDKVRAKKHTEIASFFNFVASLSNVVGGSSKRQDFLRKSQIARVEKALQQGDISNGRGKNQESTIKKAGDTRWSSHYGTLLSIVSLFPSIIDVLDMIEDDGPSLEQQGDAVLLMKYMQSFEFIFILHLMKKVLGITHHLSQALQRSDQDIVNAMKLVKMSKQRLQAIRDDGWDSLLNEVSLFCEQHDVVILNMDDAYITYKKSKRNLPKVSNLHRFQVQVFYEVIDRQLQELNNRFTEVSTELLLCIACLSPRDSFSAFDKERLNRLAQFYPLEFSPVELLALDDELDTYFVDVCSDSDFLELEGIGDLSLKLVETGKHIVYPLVYLLLKLSLILPVATASAERAFSAMSIIKNRMRNRMGDEWLNNCLVTYIEGDILVGIENEKIIQRFQNMNNRRGKL